MENMKTQMLIYGWIHFYGQHILDWMDGFDSIYAAFLTDAEQFLFSQAN